MKKNIPFKLGKNFDKIIESQLKKPEIAIIELISNSWDAYAGNVKIQWPIIEGIKDKKEKFTILDDGDGMTRDEFIEKWSCIGYNKQNNTLKQNDERKIIEKNGRGRLGLFCFSDKYIGTVHYLPNLGKSQITLETIISLETVIKMIKSSI